MSIKEFIKTNRLKQHVWSNSLEATPTKKDAILFIHGNGSSAAFWESVISSSQLSEKRCVAPDLRGYGLTDSLPIDATNSMQDVVLDLDELVDELQISAFHIVAHSLGGAVAYQLASKITKRIKSMVLVNPCSPFGFGGTKGVEGESCWPDYAGSGGGIANQAFVTRLAKKDRSSRDPQSSPRMVMNTYYWNELFKPSEEVEEKLLNSLLSVKVGDHFYPGDFEISPNYPFVKPGKFGPINALSPKYMQALVPDFVNRTADIPILWIRGEFDQIVSDQSLFDFGWLGMAGFMDDYPGAHIYPAQPMVSQTRSVLEKRSANFKEVVFKGCGHSPFLEQEALFLKEITQFFQENGY